MDQTPLPNDGGPEATPPEKKPLVLFKDKPLPAWVVLKEGKPKRQTRPCLPITKAEIQRRQRKAKRSIRLREMAEKILAERKRQRLAREKRELKRLKKLAAGKKNTLEVLFKYEKTGGRPKFKKTVCVWLGQAELAVCLKYGPTYSTGIKALIAKHTPKPRKPKEENPDGT